MPQIKFTQDYATKANPPERFRKDQTVERSAESAQHFINRGVAELVEGEELTFEPGQFSPSKASVGPQGTPEEEVLAKDRADRPQPQLTRRDVTAPAQPQQQPAQQAAAETRSSRAGRESK